jgi:hypothetical protein
MDCVRGREGLETCRKTTLLSPIIPFLPRSRTSNCALHGLSVCSTTGYWGANRRRRHQRNRARRFRVPNPRCPNLRKGCRHRPSRTTQTDSSGAYLGPDISSWKDSGWAPNWESYVLGRWALTWRWMSPIIGCSWARMRLHAWPCSIPRVAHDFRAPQRPGRR